MRGYRPRVKARFEGPGGSTVMVRTMTKKQQAAILRAAKAKKKVGGDKMDRCGFDPRWHRKDAI